MQTVQEDTELTEQPPPNRSLQPQTQPQADYNPCSNAKIASPFYLYNHDSPRPSFDVKNSDSATTTIKDLEAGPPNLTPTITEEKRDAQAKNKGIFRFWSNKQSCMTKPQRRGCGWLSRLPPKQRLLVKILIALTIIGAAVGIAVGISIRVNGRVYKSNNSSVQIGN
ncbi:hypothetical protein PV10_02231 [Exophiala mesophila]|uniref:Uncharacterized protein n=1 Tax=Exophiala mesophila TaxID=212818 RepID=A0A0D1ZKP4_EXOME|nr:uncharacterized protein PV10_02231 [Exophiala mesophila]KIV94464.1 hypothetical protein PV10_02231 [Exophiala mesophila]